MSLQLVINILAVWFVVSIPASFLIGWFFSVKNHLTDSLENNTQNVYNQQVITNIPEYYRLDETG